MYIKVKQRILDVVIAIVAIAIIVAIIAMIGSYVINPKVVKDAEKIEWCESTDDANHADIKSDLEKLIEDKYDVEVNKVAFMMNIGNYAYHTYSLDVWYRTSDGTWYFKVLDDWDIPLDLDEKLIEQVMFG